MTYAVTKIAHHGLTSFLDATEYDCLWCNAANVNKHSKCKPTLVWRCLCRPLVSNCPAVKTWRATPWNKTALALTIPISMLVSPLFCLSGVTGKFKCNRQHLIYQGKKWHRTVIMQMHLHEKFKNQMTSPGVPTLTEEGREAHPREKHDTPWRIVKALSPPAASGKWGYRLH